MKELVGTRLLQNRLNSEFEPSEIFRGLDENNFDDIKRLWQPLLQSRSAQFPSWAEAADANAQDAHWNWVKKAKLASRSLQYDTFSVECGAQTQGLMLVDVTKFAGLQGQRGLELVYIELIATAPWNRPKLVAEAKYKGVGRLLLGTAISLSVELGFKGRVGLHSLPQSESWYRSEAGFTDCGYDQAKRMQYFEMSEAQAAAFISEE